MALIYCELDKKKIEDLILSDDFSKFKVDIENMLNIQNIKYEIITKDIAVGEDGYPEQSTNASLTFNNNYEKIDKLFLYTESIKESINSKFLKLSTNYSVFSRAINIFVKSTLVHELIHVQQFQQGRINKNIMEEQKKLQYKDRPLEIEANNRSREIISSYGEFDAKIAEYIYSNQSIDNSSLTMIFELFSKQSE